MPEATKEKPKHLEKAEMRLFHGVMDRALLEKLDKHPIMKAD